MVGFNVESDNFSGLAVASQAPSLVFYVAVAVLADLE